VEIKVGDYDSVYGIDLTHFRLMMLTVTAKDPRIEKQIANAIPACIPTSNPSWALIPAQSRLKLAEYRVIRAQKEQIGFNRKCDTSKSIVLNETNSINSRTDIYINHGYETCANNQNTKDFKLTSLSNSVE